MTKPATIDIEWSQNGKFWVPGTAKKGTFVHNELTKPGQRSITVAEMMYRLKEK